MSEARAEGESGILGLYDGPLELMFEPMTSHGRFDYQDFTLLDLFDARSTTTVRYPLTFTVFPEGP